MKLVDIKKGPASSRDAEQGYNSMKYEIYEWLSTILVKILLFTPITANQITILSVLFVYAAAFLFGTGQFLYSITGIVFLYLGELMDAVDGTLARCKKTCSKLQSNFLGNLYHSSTYPVLFLGMGFGVFTQTNNPWYFLWGSLAAFFQESVAFLRFLKNNIMFKNKEMFKDKESLLSEPDESSLFEAKQNKIKRSIVYLFTAPMHHLRPIIILAVIFNKLDWFVLFYGFFVPIKSVGFCYSIYRSFKRLESKK